MDALPVRLLAFTAFILGLAGSLLSLSALVWFGVMYSATTEYGYFWFIVLVLYLIPSSFGMLATQLSKCYPSLFLTIRHGNGFQHEKGLLVVLCLLFSLSCHNRQGFYKSCNDYCSHWPCSSELAGTNRNYHLRSSQVFVYLSHL